MTSSESTPHFTGSVAQIYARHMVPMLFAPYAIDLAARARADSPQAVLELAAGTGVVTRELARDLPASCTLTASDLSEAMLERASAEPIDHPVEWRRADAMDLPWPDAQFDRVLCQFGVMFFPDKARAYAQALRVLRPGGRFVFNTWGRLADNDFAQCLNDALARHFPTDPPDFIARVPHGYHDTARITADLVQAGFTRNPQIQTLGLRSVAPSAADAALAFCQGTPLRAEIEARSPGQLDAVTQQVADAFGARFGDGPIEGGMLAHVVTVGR